MCIATLLLEADVIQLAALLCLCSAAILGFAEMMTIKLGEMMDQPRHVRVAALQARRFVCQCSMRGVAHSRPLALHN